MASLFDNDEMVYEILSWLPAKELGRLKCTNRRFRDLISETHFLLSQARRSIDNICGLLSVAADLGKNIVYISMDSSSPQQFSVMSSPSIELLATCNGLLLCKKDMSYILINPTTKVALHTFKLHTFKRLFHRIGMFGLAYNPLAQESTFKVVNIYIDSGFYEFTIYTPELGWGELHQTLPCYENNLGIMKLVSPVFISGALHWLITTGDIVAYDVEGEKASKISSPTGERPESTFGYSSLLLGVSQGCLCLVKVEEWEMVVWLLEGHERGKWGMKKSIGRIEANLITKNVVPVFYDDKNCVLLRWKDPSLECALAVYKIKENKWYEMGGLQSWMCRIRYFVPCISHMLGKPDHFSEPPRPSLS